MLMYNKLSGSDRVKKSEPTWSCLGLTTAAVHAGLWVKWKEEGGGIAEQVTLAVHEMKIESSF